MRFGIVSVVALSFIVSLGSALTGCSNDSDGPTPFDPTKNSQNGGTVKTVIDGTETEEQILASLDIGLDEPIGEEDPNSATDPETGDRADEVDPTGAVDNPIPDGPGEQGGFEVLPALPDDGPSDPTGLTTTQSVQFGTLHPLTDPGSLPASETRRNVGAVKYRCRQRTTRPCVCEGSPVNCELPSEQPGRNRYIPTTKLADLASKPGSKHDHIDKIGRWGINVDASLYDGTGGLRGNPVVSGCYDWDGNTTKQIDGQCAKLNFGQRKQMTINGKTSTYVYAWSVTVKGKSESSWIPQSAVKSDHFLAMPTVKNPAIGSLVATKYVLKSAEDWGQTMATYASKSLPSWAHSKVSKGGGGKLASDYLLRDGNVINLAYHTPGVGGAATDTLAVGSSTLGFQRVKSTAAQTTLVRVKVYDPTKTSMLFAYGQINGRYGWVPLESIKQGDVKADVADAGKPKDPTPDSCVNKADGLYCSDTVSTMAYVCVKGVKDPNTQTCSGGQLCIGAASDGPNGEKRIACQ